MQKKEKRNQGEGHAENHLRIQAHLCMTFPECVIVIVTLILSTLAASFSIVKVVVAMFATRACPADAWDPRQSTKLLSQDQGFYEGWTDEHKSLPHFSFLFFKVDVVLGFWNLRIPLVVRIHAQTEERTHVGDVPDNRMRAAHGSRNDHHENHSTCNGQSQARTLMSFLCFRVQCVVVQSIDLVRTECAASTNQKTRISDISATAHE